jgi:hypothetical protein
MLKNKNPLETLRGLADALEYAEKMEKILEVVWDWAGPYGWIRNKVDFNTMQRAQEKIRADPDLRAYFLSLEMPAELHSKLREHFRFDDSE